MNNFLENLEIKLEDIVKNSSIDKSYTKSLTHSGSEKIAKKVIEEAFEVCLASIEGKGHKNGKNQLILESADLLYHLLVLLSSKNVSVKEVFNELKKREV